MKLAVNTVTLRSYTPEEIISILSDNRIDAVEWGGDVHVPPGDLQTAASVKSLCDKAGITCTSLGSYYQCDEGGQGEGPFRFNLGAPAILDSAKALGVPAIRVWAGRMGSASASLDYREVVARCLAVFCDQANDLGMTVHLEFHPNTLTDTVDSTLALIEAVAKDNLYSYWQPRHGVDVKGNLADIAALGDHLSHVHVFHWLLQDDGTTIERRPLIQGKERWKSYFSALENLPGERYAMIEFVKDDDLAQLAEDLDVLRSINKTTCKTI